MTISILSLLFLLQSWTLTGSINDQESGAPIAGAKIEITGSNRDFISDENGTFALPDLETDSIEISIKAEGYLEKTFKISRTDQVLRIVLQKREYTGETVVIRAIRGGSEAPVSQTILGKARLEDNYFGQDMPYLLTQTPSITAYSDGGIYTGYSYLRLRGIDMTRLNFTLNGVPLNEPEDQGVYFSNFADFGNSIRSVQVQRGVGTSSFGSASFGGSVNFQSESLLDAKPSAEVQLGYGSFNSFRYAAEAKTGLIDDKFGFYARYSGTGTDGYRYNSGARSHSFFGSGGWFGDNDMVKVTAFTGQTKNQMAYLATDINDINVDPRTNYLSPAEKDDFVQDFAQVEYVHQFSKRTALASTVYYSRVAGDFDVLVDSTLLNFVLDSDFAGAMVNLNYETEKLKVWGGLHGNLYRRDHSMVIKPWIDSNIYFNTGHKQEVSAFAKAEYKIGKLSLFGDLQLRHAAFQYSPESSYGLAIDPVSWTFFNPKIGLTYKVNSHLSAFASAGQTGREPTRTDMLGGNDDIDPFNYAQLNDLTRVQPETVTDIEAGLAWNFKRGTVRANLYAMEFRNEIAAIGQLSYLGLPLRKNVKRSFRRGIELEWGYKITKGLQTGGNLNLSWNQIAEFTTDFDSLSYTNVQPLLTPPVLGNAWLKYELKQLLEFELISRYQGESYLDNTNNDALIAPAYFLLDFRTTLKFLKKHSLTFQLNNVLNQQYYTSGYGFLGSPNYYVQAPRNFYATLYLRF